MKNRIIKTLTLFLLFCQSPEASAQENSPTAQAERGSEDATALIDRPLMSLKAEAEAIFNTMVYKTEAGWETISQVVKELANDSSWNAIEEKARERAFFGGLLGIMAPIMDEYESEYKGDEATDWNSYISSTADEPEMKPMKIHAWRETHGQMSLRTLMIGLARVSERQLKKEAIGREKIRNFESSFTNSAGMEMLPVKPGKVGPLEIGKPEEFASIEIRKPYFLAKTEVTQGQWRDVMGEKPSLFEGEDYPVITPWNEAMEFCRRLTEHERQSGTLPDGYEYTLPTEQQWEYACRAGTTGDHAGPLDEMAWHGGNSGGRTQPIGTKRANAWGFHDMHGNVWDWCLNSLGRGRAMRGGSANFTAEASRSGFRHSWNPEGLHKEIKAGFRPALVKTE